MSYLTYWKMHLLTKWTLLTSSFLLTNSIVCCSNNCVSNLFIECGAAEIGTTVLEYFWLTPIDNVWRATANFQHGLQCVSMTKSSKYRALGSFWKNVNKVADYSWIEDSYRARTLWLLVTSDKVHENSCGELPTQNRQVRLVL